MTDLDTIVDSATIQITVAGPAPELATISSSKEALLKDRRRRCELEKQKLLHSSTQMMGSPTGAASFAYADGSGNAATGGDRKRHMSDTCLVSSTLPHSSSRSHPMPETTDKTLRAFLLSERSGRRPAICSRIDKIYHNRQLINYMEYLLREDYIRNFLL